jgi:hypothetical protein
MASVGAVADEGGAAVAPSTPAPPAPPAPLPASKIAKIARMLHGSPTAEVDLDLLCRVIDLVGHPAHLEAVAAHASRLPAALVRIAAETRNAEVRHVAVMFLASFIAHDGARAHVDAVAFCVAVMDQSQNGGATYSDHSAQCAAQSLHAYARDRRPELHAHFEQRPCAILALVRTLESRVRSTTTECARATVWALRTAALVLESARPELRTALCGILRAAPGMASLRDMHESAALVASLGFAADEIALFRQQCLVLSHLVSAGTSSQCAADACSRHATDGGAPLLKCGRCRAVAYCGIAHQRSDWPRHRPACNPAAAAPAEAIVQR